MAERTSLDPVRETPDIARYRRERRKKWKRGPKVRGISSARDISTGQPVEEQIARQEQEFGSTLRRDYELRRMRAPKARGRGKFRTGNDAAEVLAKRVKR